MYSWILEYLRYCIFQRSHSGILDCFYFCTVPCLRSFNLLCILQFSSPVLQHTCSLSILYIAFLAFWLFVSLFIFSRSCILSVYFVKLLFLCLSESSSFNLPDLCTSLLHYLLYLPYFRLLICYIQTMDLWKFVGSSLSYIATVFHISLPYDVFPCFLSF